MEKQQFKAESKKLLEMMINSIYTHKEIFLRELISNASDAIDKLYFKSLTDDSVGMNKDDFEILISLDKDNRTITISDNGIGMDESDLINNLGTIARSGTKGFIDSMSGDAKKDSSLIGQFGVGFYSAFMVASKIEAISRKALSDEAYKWSSDTNGYEISKSSLSNHGTQITLYLNDDEFCDSFRVENIITKYSPIWKIV